MTSLDNENKNPHKAAWFIPSSNQYLTYQGIATDRNYYETAASCFTPINRDSEPVFNEYSTFTNKNLLKKDTYSPIESQLGTKNIEALAAALGQVQRDLFASNKKIEEFKKFISEFDKKIEEFDKKIEESKIKIVESLGIFVALFTFISIEFQIFKEVSNILIYFSLSFAALGLLCWFILIMDYVLRSNLNQNKDNQDNQDKERFSYIQIRLIVGTILFILFGGAFAVCGYANKKTIINKQSIEINQNSQSINSNSIR